MVVQPKYTSNNLLRSKRILVVIVLGKLLEVYNSNRGITILGIRVLAYGTSR